MKKITFILFLIYSPFSISRGVCTKNEAATAVRKACSFIIKNGIEEFRIKNEKERFCSDKSGYVFVMKDVDNLKIIHHPTIKKLENTLINNLVDYRSPPVSLGEMFHRAVVSKHKSSWVYYEWLKPGEKKSSVKQTILLNCDGRFAVGAGLMFWDIEEHY